MIPSSQRAAGAGRPAPAPLKDQIVRLAQATEGKPSLFAEYWLGWKPFEKQKQWMDLPLSIPTTELVTGRRYGKSETEGIKALALCILRPGFRQLSTSVTVDQARLAFDTAAEYCVKNPLIAPLVKPGYPKFSPFPRIHFINGSSYEVRSSARQGVYIRGHKYHRATVDEADYVDEEIVEQVILMTLADVGGQLSLVTTPKLKRGFVYKNLIKARAGDPSIFAITGSTYDNPHVDHAYIKSLETGMTYGAKMREIYGEYTDDEDTVFTWEEIRRIFETWDEWAKEYGSKVGWRPKLQKARNLLDPFAIPFCKGRKYVMGVDVAKEVDWTVITVLDVTTTPYTLVYHERFQKQPWPYVAQRIDRVFEDYDLKSHEAALDSTGIGEAVKDMLKYQVQPFNFNRQSKIDLITNLQLVLQNGELRGPYIESMMSELEMYQWDDKNIVTDNVMSLALAVWAADKGRSRKVVTW